MKRRAVKRISLLGPFNKPEPGLKFRRCRRCGTSVFVGELDITSDGRCTACLHEEVIRPLTKVQGQR